MPAAWQLSTGVLACRDCQHGPQPESRGQTAPPTIAVGPWLAPSTAVDMAERDGDPSLHIPWTTLLKVILAVALVAVLVRIWYILTLILIAIIVAIGLQPAVAWLERR